MRIKNIFAIFFIGVISFIGIFPSNGFSAEIEKNAEFYNHFVMKEITKCQSKMIMLNSNSDNLRNYALLEVQKAAFYLKEKDTLIGGMMAQNIRYKDYQVEYYLNCRFKEFNN